MQSFLDDDPVGASFVLVVSTGDLGLLKQTHDRVESRAHVGSDAFPIMYSGEVFGPPLFLRLSRLAVHLLEEIGRGNPARTRPVSAPATRQTLRREPAESAGGGPFAGSFLALGEEFTLAVVADDTEGAVFALYHKGVGGPA